MSPSSPTPPDQTETTIMQTDDPLFFSMGNSSYMDPYQSEDPGDERKRRAGDLSHLPFFDHRQAKQQKKG